jgi:hypothetical protein
MNDPKCFFNIRKVVVENVVKKHVVESGLVEKKGFPTITMSSQDKATLNLPLRFFNRLIYNMIHEFLENKPIFTPCHL